MKVYDNKKHDTYLRSHKLYDQTLINEIRKVEGRRLTAKQLEDLCENDQLHTLA